MGDRTEPATGGAAAKETARAFVAVDGPVRLDGAPDGPLAGLTFGAKDLFDVAGHRTGGGNPDWLRTHPPAERTASAVATLVAAGAALVGKTLTDELAYSILGQNHWYGTPPNPAAPDHLTGGSSSGSASATAAGDVDFAIGTDTGGSVRVPASWCGLFGIRPTHGATDLTGVIPLAPSFDTVGWFTRSPDLLARIGRVLLRLPAEPEPAPITRLLRIDELWALADPAISDAADTWLTAMVTTTPRPAAESSSVHADHGPLSPPASAGGGPAGADGGPLAVDQLVRVADFLPPRLDRAEAFRILQAAEVRNRHQRWIEATHPIFGPGVADRFAALVDITRPQIREAGRWRASFANRVTALLTPGTALVLPTTPVPAPRRDAAPDELAEVRPRIMGLTAVAGLAGLPQVTVPALVVDGLPVGVSFVGAPGSDHALLDLAARTRVGAAERP